MRMLKAAALLLCLAEGTIRAEPSKPATAKAPGEECFEEYTHLLKSTHGTIDDRHVAALRKGAGMGHEICVGILGVYLISERGPSDPEAIKEGVSWLKRIEAVEKPEMDGAAFMLGLCYLNGMGTKQDLERAGLLLKRSSARGNSDMKMAYALYLHEFKKEIPAAKRVLEEVAKDPSNPEAQQEAKELLRSMH